MSARSLQALFTCRVSSRELAETQKIFTALKVPFLVCRVTDSRGEASFADMSNSLGFEVGIFNYLVNYL